MPCLAASTGKMSVGTTAKMAVLLPFPLSAAEQWQDEQVCEDVNDTTGEHHQTEPLRRWKIGQHENGKTGGEDHVGIDNAAPLILARSHPGCPAFLSVALRAANPENKMDHRVDRDPDADIGGWRGEHIHRHAQPANPAQHAERHESQAQDHRQRPAHRAGDNPCDHDEQKVEPEQTGHETGGDQLRQPALEVVDTADQLRFESILPTNRAQVVDDLEAIFITTLLDHSNQEHRTSTPLGTKA